VPVMSGAAHGPQFVVPPGVSLVSPPRVEELLSNLRGQGRAIRDGGGANPARGGGGKNARKRDEGGAVRGLQPPTFQ
jgi:hypothetical protein